MLEWGGLLKLGVASVLLSSLLALFLLLSVRTFSVKAISTRGGSA